jgi:NTE family protein
MLSKFLTALGFVFCLLLSAEGRAADGDPATLENDGPSIGLALGSGGASGLAHIAVLEVFDEQGIRPAHISGTSIGAVIGGLYAAGLSGKEIRALFAEFDGEGVDFLSKFNDSGLGLGDLFNMAFGEGGTMDQSGLIEYLAEQVNVRGFHELQVPLSIVATDFWTGEAVVIEEGDIFDAMEASMAVPGLFRPVKRGDQLLVDGGLANPLPFDLLTGRHDSVIAVDVTGERQPGDEDVETTDILFKTFEIMQQSIIRQMRTHSQPDLYLKPESDDIQLLHFNRLSKILEMAEPAADELRDFLESH